MRSYFRESWFYPLCTVTVGATLLAFVMAR